MTTSFSAQVTNFSRAALEKVELVVKQSAQDVGEKMSVAKDGLVRGAPFETGVVPVDQGDLIGSLIVTIGGTITGQGSSASATPPDYFAALAGFDMGDVITIGFTARYAPIIEYGARGVPGRFMVRQAIQQWPQIVATNAARVKD